MIRSLLNTLFIVALFSSSLIAQEDSLSSHFADHFNLSLGGWMEDHINTFTTGIEATRSVYHDEHQAIHLGLGLLGLSQQYTDRNLHLSSFHVDSMPQFYDTDTIDLNKHQSLAMQFLAGYKILATERLGIEARAYLNYSFGSLFGTSERTDFQSLGISIFSIGYYGGLFYVSKVKSSCSP